MDNSPMDNIQVDVEAVANEREAFKNFTAEVRGKKLLHVLTYRTSPLRWTCSVRLTADNSQWIIVFVQDLFTLCKDDHDVHVALQGHLSLVAAENAVEAAKHLTVKFPNCLHLFISDYACAMKDYSLVLLLQVLCAEKQDHITFPGT